MKEKRSRLNEKVHDRTVSIMTAGKKLQQKEKKTEDQKDMHLVSLVFNYLSRVPKLCRKNGVCRYVWVCMDPIILEYLTTTFNADRKTNLNLMNTKKRMTALPQFSLGISETLSSSFVINIEKCHEKRTEDKEK